jgi:hypothetical protein
MVYCGPCKHHGIIHKGMGSTIPAFHVRFQTRCCIHRIESCQILVASGCGTRDRIRRIEPVVVVFVPYPYLGWGYINSFDSSVMVILIYYTVVLASTTVSYIKVSGFPPLFKTGHPPSTSRKQPHLQASHMRDLPGLHSHTQHRSVVPCPYLGWGYINSFGPSTMVTLIWYTVVLASTTPLHIKIPEVPDVLADGSSVVQFVLCHHRYPTRHPARHTIVERRGRPLFEVYRVGICVSHTPT